jgi:sec-independent protein translocase protein TatB
VSISRPAAYSFQEEEAAVFENLGGWELLGLVLLALFIFGPERLPKVIGDAARLLRGLRQMARNATNDLSRELGTEVRLQDLHPKAFLRRHLLSEEEEQQLRRPIDEIQRDLRGIAADAGDPWPGRELWELREPNGDRRTPDQARADRSTPVAKSPSESGPAGSGGFDGDAT